MDLDRDELNHTNELHIVDSVETAEDADVPNLALQAEHQRSNTPASSVNYVDDQYSTPLQSFLRGRSHPGRDDSTSDLSHQRSHVAIPALLNAGLAPLVVIPPSTYEHLPYSTSRSGLVYDVRMRFHQDPQPDASDPHPETPQRIACIFNELVDAGLAPDPRRPEMDNEHQLVRIGIRQATDEEICLVHSPAHIEFVKDLSGQSIDWLKAIAAQADSIYYHNLSWLAASLAAGGAIEAAKAVYSGLVKNAVALIRPPGHHAEHGAAEGFCFFNNVCIATKIIQQDYAECRKVLILDWDVHHGNGIQRTFYDDPNVLYISLHRYNPYGIGGEAPFYPMTDYGAASRCGNGPGLGRNVNIAWTRKHMGDSDYIFAFQQVVMPIAIEFDPDLVIISAGFDAAFGDPLGDCLVSPAGYAHMTHMLMQLAKGKVVACLEGGYNLRSISVSALAMTRVLMGEPPDRIVDTEPSRSGVFDVYSVIRIQSRFWKSLYPKQRELQVKQKLCPERLHDIIREWQANSFWDKYKMVPLMIYRQRISRTFQNQVLATLDYGERKPLLVVFHDPPQIQGFSDPRTAELELHNTFLTDVSKSYIDWAVRHGFAAIDVNMPKHITGENDDLDFVESELEQRRQEATRQVALYLWQNYIESTEATHIFLLGIGDAYGGILALLSEHAEALEQIDFATVFIAEQPIRSFRSEEPDAIDEWWRKSSVYVHQDHDFWHEPEKKQRRRRYGAVKRSTETNMQEMLHRHQPEVTAKWRELTADWRQTQPDTRSGDIADHEDHDITLSNMNGERETALPDHSRPMELDEPANVPKIVKPSMPPVGHFPTSPMRPSSANNGNFKRSPSRQ